MAIPAGIAGQLGFGSESTVGTAVTVDEFHCGFLGGRLAEDQTHVVSDGLRAGRLTEFAWKQGAKRYAGDLTVELYDEPLATLLLNMFGSVVTTGSGPYTHTATPADLTGQAMTVQLGAPDIGGTVNTFTYAGTKVSSWELQVDADASGPPTLRLGLVAMTYADDTALASASYPTAAPFTFVEGSVTIAGSSVATVKSARIRGDNSIESRIRVGAATSREPLQSSRHTYDGEIVADFESLTALQRFSNGTESALVLALDNGTDSLTITCNVRYTGETPEVRDGLLEQRLPFVCTSGTSDAAAITAVLVNAETAAS